MENKQEIFDALEVLSDQNKENPINNVLEQYLCKIAKTGITGVSWSQLKPLITIKMDLVLNEFEKKQTKDDLKSNFPNVENLECNEMRKRLHHCLNLFNGIPFTIQRICQLLTDKSIDKQYRRIDKFMRGLEKNFMVVTTVDPFGKRIVCEQKASLNGSISDYVIKNENINNNNNNNNNKNNFKNINNNSKQDETNSKIENSLNHDTSVGSNSSSENLLNTTLTCSLLSPDTSPSSVSKDAKDIVKKEDNNKNINKTTINKTDSSNITPNKFKKRYNENNDEMGESKDDDKYIDFYDDDMKRKRVNCTPPPNKMMRISSSIPTSSSSSLFLESKHIQTAPLLSELLNSNISTSSSSSHSSYSSPSSQSSLLTTSSISINSSNSISNNNLVFTNSSCSNNIETNSNNSNITNSVNTTNFNTNNTTNITSTSTTKNKIVNDSIINNKVSSDSGLQTSLITSITNITINTASASTSSSDNHNSFIITNDDANSANSKDIIIHNNIDNDKMNIKKDKGDNNLEKNDKEINSSSKESNNPSISTTHDNLINNTNICVRNIDQDGNNHKVSSISDSKSQKTLTSCESIKSNHKKEGDMHVTNTIRTDINEIQKEKSTESKHFSSIESSSIFTTSDNNKNIDKISNAVNNKLSDPSDEVFVKDQSNKIIDNLTSNSSNETTENLS